MRMSLPGSVGLPGSVYSSSLPLPLRSSTNGAQPCALAASPVSSHTAVSIQAATGPLPLTHSVMGAEASIDEAVLHRLGIEHGDLARRAFKRERLGGRVVRS